MPSAAYVAVVAVELFSILLFRFKGDDMGFPDGTVAVLRCTAAADKIFVKETAHYLDGTILTTLFTTAHETLQKEPPPIEWAGVKTRHAFNFQV